MVRIANGEPARDRCQVNNKFEFVLICSGSGA